MRRNKAIDIAKGIGIIVMVLGHCYHEKNVILKLIYAFHMPLFFIITGILLSMHTGEEKIVVHIKKRISRLLVPYFWFELAYAVLLSSIAFLAHENPINRFMGCIKPTVMLIGKTVTWYLPCLFLAEIIFGVLLKLRTRTVCWIIIMVCFVVGLLSPIDGVLIVLWRSLVGMGFIGIGYLYAGFFMKETRDISLVIVAVVFSVSGMFNVFVSMVDSRYGNYLLYIISSITGSFLLIQLSLKLNKGLSADNHLRYFIEYYGRNTIIILGTHMLIIEIIRLADNLLFHNLLFSLGLVESIILGGIVLLLEIPIIFLIDSKLRFVIGDFSKHVLKV